MKIRKRDGTTTEVDDTHILQDGELLVFGLLLMDAQRGVVRDARGEVAGTRPGFLFADNEADDQAREAAYREYAVTVSERWLQPQVQRSSSKQAGPPPTFASPEAAVAAAYAEYNRTIQERWRK